MTNIRNVFFERKVTIEFNSKVAAAVGWIKSIATENNRRGGEFGALLGGADKKIFSFGGLTGRWLKVSQEYTESRVEESKERFLAESEL